MRRLLLFRAQVRHVGLGFGRLFRKVICFIVVSVKVLGINLGIASNYICP